jgi:hypothetical protein
VLALLLLDFFSSCTASSSAAANSPVAVLSSWAVVPATISASSLTGTNLQNASSAAAASSLPVSLVVMFYNATLGVMNLGNFLGPRIRGLISFSVDQSSHEVEPYGFASYVNELCPTDNGRGPCASLELLNDSAIVVFSFHPVAAFDIRFDQTVVISFSGEIFQPKFAAELVSLDVSFVISASPSPPKIFGSYIIGVPLLCVSFVSQLAVPNHFDIVPFLLATQGPCSTTYMRSWSLFSLYGPYWAGGDEIVNRCLRMVGIVAFLHVSVLVGVAGVQFFLSRSSSSSGSRDFLVEVYGHVSSLASCQVTLLFAATAAYSSSALISHPRTLYQSVGILVLVVFLFAFVIVAKRVWLDSEWTFVCLQKTASRIGLTDVSGYWFSGRYVLPASVREHHRQSSSPDKATERRQSPLHSLALDKFILFKEHEGFRSLTNAFFVSSEASSPNASAEVNKRAVACFYVVLLLPLFAAGISSRSPNGCFWQNAGVSALHFTVAAFSLKFVAPRCRSIFFVSIMIRIVNALVFLIISLLGDSQGAESAFVALEIALLLLALFRLGIVSAVWRHDAARVQQALGPWVTEVLALPPLGGGGGPAAPEASSPTSLDEAAQPLLHVPVTDDGTTTTQITAQLDGSPVDGSPSMDESQREKDGSVSGRQSSAPALAATSDGAAVISEAEPRFIREAWPAKPKPRAEDYIEMTHPLWFPSQRPHVRTHNMPQLSVEYSSYSVRKT